MKRNDRFIRVFQKQEKVKRFPAQAKQLNAAFDMRLMRCWLKMQMQSKEKQYHLKRQILPGISAYETLQRVMPKKKHCKPFTAMWSTWRERGTNNLPPCCTYRGFTALFRRFVKSTRAFSARRRALSQKNCRPVTASGVWI